ncbi:MAG: S-methyl-5-thioribose-1-phosphate isomerase [Candidatus Kariarchaeaceae archaeon]
MRIKVKDKTIETTTIEWDHKSEKLILIDQRALPHKLDFLEYSSLDGIPEAIQTMVVRGAPAIGVTGVFGLLLKLKEVRGKDMVEIADELEEAYHLLLDTRPTAVDLEKMMKDWLRRVELKKFSWPEGERLALEIFGKSKEECYQIGIHGANLINERDNILTHCNAGALATIDYGTALAPLRIAHDKGVNFHVWVNETRPRLQGARLTSWELFNEEIDHDVIADNAAAYYMSEGMVNLVIVGADRVTGDGWFANKIGTHGLAIVAKYYEIPFYVAIPWSTFQISSTKEDASIEERSPDEVRKCLHGHLLVNEGSSARNPAFDWTKVELVSGFITPEGIFTYDQLIELKS